MKQVININFQGRVVPIETTAFEILKNYTDSLSRHFANEEGKEEIINDIESRIGELFQERLTKGATCITDDDVNAIINSIGRPEDFEPMDDAQPTSSSASSSSTYQQQSTNSSSTSTGHKRLYRNENDKVLGGVCSGLANYFNIDVVIARIIFVVLLFSGIGFLTYIIMWIAVPSTASAEIGSTRKKLFRDPDEKMIAGVCSGIGNYFGINPWIPRVLFLLPFLSFLSRWGHWGGFWDFGDVVRFTFSPTSLIVYIILWIVIPEAITTSEKLAMKGEKVDMNSIKNSVMEEMKGVGKKASSFGKEASGVINEKAKLMAGDVQNFSRRNRGGLGNVIAMIAKIFAYFIIGCVCFALVGALIALIAAAFKVYPLKDYLLAGNWENAFAWGTLFFFITVPVIGIIIWLIRKLTKSKTNSKMLRLTFICLWIIGWVCIVCLASNLNKDFSYRSSLQDEDIALSNPKVNKLVLTSSVPFEKSHSRYRWSRFDSFEDFINEDTMYLQNIKIDFIKSPDSSFHVSMLKSARGYSKQNANELASKVLYNIKQNDSLLVFDKGIAVNKTDKIRNQNVFITVYVPIGKQVRVNNNFERKLYYNGRFLNISFDDRDDYYDNDNENSRWQSDVDYIMKVDGLYTLDGRKADGWNDRDGNRQKEKKNKRSGSYRYDNIQDSLERRQDSIENRNQQKIDSIERRTQHIKDSIDRQSEKEKSKLENSNGSVQNNEPGDLSTIITPGVNILTNMN
ncbi:PspC domain-containing protein [Ferruginibacter sp. SUN106]|uniref:PspC domain-containing protein n=1 Tax=Ferruginibacter sp. SUN106 TaxID=2978348 RepID=UPI003D35BEA5